MEELSQKLSWTNTNHKMIPLTNNHVSNRGPILHHKESLQKCHYDSFANWQNIFLSTIINWGILFNLFFNLFFPFSYLDSAIIVNFIDPEVIVSWIKVFGFNCRCLGTWQCSLTIIDTINGCHYCNKYWYKNISLAAELLIPSHTIANKIRIIMKNSMVATCIK